MQRDTHLTFREIYGSIESFQANVREIEHLALVHSLDDAPLQPRFLKPRYDTPDCVEFDVTLPQEYNQGEDYIAVSYTWAHSESGDDYDIPNYQIRDGHVKQRSLRCPPIVFHRALQFAHAKSSHLIWIDQECIDQDDPTDVEIHLQIMHRIYRQSRWTIAILSCHLAEDASLGALVRLLHEAYGTHMTDIDMFPGIPHENQLRYELCIPAIVQMLEDRWFTRTWTFHEMLCATNLSLLVPVSNTYDHQPFYQTLAIGTDICFPAGQFETVLINIPDDMAEVVNPLQPILTNVLFESDLHGTPLVPFRTYVHMEDCNNLVVSDRLAILANACGFENRLNTTLLNKEKFSYSTCMLVLLMANMWPDERERRAMWKQHGADIWDEEPFRERFQEWQSSTTVKNLQIAQYKSLAPLVLARYDSGKFMRYRVSTAMGIPSAIL